jgi:hypothetical protein
MHVLPLPFGMALALVPRREADRLRRRELLRPLIRNTVSPRDRIRSDLRYYNPFGHV